MVVTAKSTCTWDISRDTKVITREDTQPISVRDLRIGQHVLCYEASPDMLVPGGANLVCSEKLCECQLLLDMLRHTWGVDT